MIPILLYIDFKINYVHQYSLNKNLQLITLCSIDHHYMAIYIKIANKQHKNLFMFYDFHAWLHLIL